MMEMVGLMLLFVLVGTSLLKQEVMKMLIMVEFLYLSVIILLSSVMHISSWLVMMVMVFSALEGVISLSLFMVMSKYKSSLSRAKFYHW